MYVELENTPLKSTVNGDKITKIERIDEVSSDGVYDTKY